MENNSRKQFGRHLRSLRRRIQIDTGTKVTQLKMAQMAGISPGYIAALEAGHRNPPREDKLVRLAAAYRTTTEDLLSAGGEVNSSRTSDPAADLEWAFTAVTNDPKYDFLRRAPSKISAKEQLSIVEIFEVSRERKLLPDEEKHAIRNMIAQRGVGTEADGTGILRPETDVILNMLKKYSGFDAIPKSAVMDGFLALLRHRIDAKTN